jgi:hypothetical protein
MSWPRPSTGSGDACDASWSSHCSSQVQSTMRSDRYRSRRQLWVSRVNGRCVLSKECSLVLELGADDAICEQPWPSQVSDPEPVFYFCSNSSTVSVINPICTYSQGSPSSPSPIIPPERHRVTGKPSHTKEELESADLNPANPYDPGITWPPRSPFFDTFHLSLPIWGSVAVVLTGIGVVTLVLRCCCRRKSFPLCSCCG